MGAPNVVPNVVQNAAEPAGKPEESKASVMGVPLTRWAVVSVSAIFVAYVAITYGIKIYDQGIAIRNEESIYSKAVTVEMQAHKNDASGSRQMLHHDNGGDIWATYFSDGCIALERPGEPLPYLSQPEAHLEWSLGPSRRPHMKAPELPNASPVLGASGSGADDQADEDHAGQGGLPTVMQAGLLDADILHPVQAGCLNPHPGQFQGWWGQPNGCWVPFWRRFNDGCTHYEMYNTCSGQWDPQIFWTFCAGQHHP